MGSLRSFMTVSSYTLTRLGRRLTAAGNPLTSLRDASGFRMLAIAIGAVVALGAAVVAAAVVMHGGEAGSAVRGVGMQRECGAGRTGRRPCATATDVASTATGGPNRSRPPSASSQLPVRSRSARRRDDDPPD